jgi:dihydroflavonol-4-reductase
MNIFVTGANGFLGSHLVRRLHTMGAAVYGLVRPNSSRDLIKDLPINLIEGDITDDLYNFNLPPLDGVFHLAAAMGTSRAVSERLQTVNVTGTQNVVNFACHHSVRRLIHVSSTVAFGALAHPGKPFNEDSCSPFKHHHLRNFESKRQGQECVLRAVREQNLNAVIVNPSLIFGSGDARKAIRSGNIKIAQGKVPFALPGGVNIVSVDDVVDGMIAAWERGRIGECYILGGENVFTKDLFGWIAEAAEQPPPQRVVPSWLLKGVSWINDTFGIDSEVNQEAVESLLLYHWCDSNKAMKELNYRPRPSKQAVFESVRWMQDHGLL